MTPLLCHKYEEKRIAAYESRGQLLEAWLALTIG